MRYYHLTMEKKWTLNENYSENEIDQLSKDLNVNNTIAKLLIKRNIKTFDEAKKFFRPSLDDLYDPFLMKDMDLAVNRLATAVQKEEKILVYGDYDVDGTTSVAVMSGFLKSLDLDILTYIPDRYTEGYGISLQGIDYAQDNKVDLIIALDCGIRAVNQVNYAKEKGIDMIICDHHLQADKIPDAVAVLDPNRKDCKYPFKGLSGCGVGFKLIQAFCIQMDLDIEKAYEYLDLLTISIGADIVPMVDENRILAHYGLIKLSENPRPGIKALLDKAGFMKTTINITDAVFTLAPRINAAGRIASGNRAVDLLMSEDYDEAFKIAEDIENYNKNRREFDSTISEEALKIIDEDSDLQEKFTTVVYNPSWHKGVIGIVASRLIESYYRPTLVLTKGEELITGSARSIPSVDIHEVLTKCDDLLEKYGGHAMAAGLSLKEENLETFKIRFEEEVKKLVTKDDLIPRLEIEAPLGLDEITSDFYKILRQFAPFGPGNLSPSFLANNIEDVQGTRAIGVDYSHLKMWVRQAEPPSPPFSGIGFGLGRFYPDFADKKRFDMVYSLEENEWNGELNLQLNVRDLRLKE